jgi:transcriptional regulator with XRE-family HTH domain
MQELGNTTIGQRVKAFRNVRSLSQAELARLSGVPLQTLKDVERGRVRMPQPRTLRNLAAALGVEPAQLRADDEPDRPVLGAL